MGQQLPQNKLGNKTQSWVFTCGHEAPGPTMSQKDTTCQECETGTLWNKGIIVIEQPRQDKFEDPLKGLCHKHLFLGFVKKKNQKQKL